MKKVNQPSLFESQDGDDDATPLAERLRPRTLDEVAGQGHLIGEGKVLRGMIANDKVPSMIFWGPPGVGKTTLANVIALTTNARFVTFSAVTSGIKDIKDVMREAEEGRVFGRKTIVFVDEIHRFNKAQQDAFLPFVEKGSIILIGATTENPSFEVNGALLSRCKVFVLKGLTEDEIVGLLRRALADPRGFGRRRVVISDDMLKAIAVFANGDARAALSTLEMVVLNSEEAGGTITVTADCVEQCTSRKSLLYDKGGEEHYNIISALHKSMRNSDPDAAVYWLARMLEGGEDPLYVARRVTRFASEDVGLADPHALEIAVAAYHACHFIGMPECAGMLRPPRGGRHLPVGRAQVQLRLHRLRKGQEGRAGARRGARPPRDPQRADEAHEGTRVRQGIPARALRREQDRRRAVPAGFAAGDGILLAHERGRRGADRQASRGDQGLEGGARPAAENHLTTRTRGGRRCGKL